MPLIKQRGSNGLSLSILCDVFLLWILFLCIIETQSQSVEIVPDVFNEDDLVLKPIPGWTEPSRDNLERYEGSNKFDSYGDFSKTTHDTIHRILRDEDTSGFRADDQKLTFRWKKSADPPMHRKVSKREIDTLLQENNSSSENSTKSLDLVNSNLTKFVIDSDLELQIKQSDDRGFISRLNLTNNFITDFNTRDLYPWLSGVRQLDLSNNNLSRFVISSASELVSVDLSNNYVSSFIIESNDTKLRTLSMQNNKLSLNVTETGDNLLNLALAKQLDTIDLSCNEISEVNSTLLANSGTLKRLNLSKNRLRRIVQDMFYNLINIDTLVLSQNQIERIDDETFLELPSLQYLDLSYNNIRAESIRSLQGIPDLVGLSIAYNPSLGDALQEFVASWSLKELDASGTGLCRIPSALAQSVRTLVLVDNWFEMIRCGDLDSYPLLQYLDLSRSHINDIEDDALGRLEMLQTLFLDHNNLKKIPVSLPTSLENLFLHYNDITDIQPQSLQQLNNLRILDLSHNKLTYIPGLPLPKLIVLNLRFSQLRGLSQSVVKMSPKLRDLLLDGNPIKCTELMGIAEWASPCLNRENLPSHLMLLGKETQDEDNRKSFMATHNYLSQFPSNWRECPGRNDDRLNINATRPQCAASVKSSLIDSNKLELLLEKPDMRRSKVPIHKTNSSNHSGEDIENSIHTKHATQKFSKNVANQEKLEKRGEIAIYSKLLKNQTPRNITDNIESSQMDPARSLAYNSTSEAPEMPINTLGDNNNFNSTNANNNQTNKFKSRQAKHSKDIALLVAKVSPSVGQPSFSSDLASQVISQQKTNATLTTSNFSKKIMRKRKPKTLAANSADDVSQKKMNPNSEPAAKTSDHGRTTNTTSSSAIESNEPFKMVQIGHQQISTTLQPDKLALLPISPCSVEHKELGKECSTAETTKASKSDSEPDIMKTMEQTKMMMLASQSKDDDAIQESARNVSQTIFFERLNVSNDTASHIMPAFDSVTNTSGNTSPYSVTTAATSTKTMPSLPRIVSKMLSSKVNKADKVVDHELLSPSAINENGIIKRNQSSVSYHSAGRRLVGVDGLAMLLPVTGSSGESRSLDQQSSMGLLLSGIGAEKTSTHDHRQDISQQNQQTPTSSLQDIKNQQPQEKVKEDKYLRFIGAKNLNLTVLTYNKGHIHKTINKDIAPQSFKSYTTISPSKQLFFELGTIGMPPIDFQLTTPAPTDPNRWSGSEGHVKVNRNRVPSESNNRQYDNNKQQGRGDADVHPQLNALHAFASLHLNTSTSANNATSHVGLPPERWLDIRNATGHPGLFIVIGLTIGIVFTLGLLHIYKCKRPASCRKASQLHQLHSNVSSPHCCSRSGPQHGGHAGNLHEYSPGHFCRYSHSSVDDDAGYYIEPDQNRIRNSTRRDFLPMELLKSSTSASRSAVTDNNAGHHCPDSHTHSIW